MRGEAGNDCGGGDTQVLDGGTPPLGSPPSDGDETQREADDWALYDETQPLDDAETQLIDEVEEGVAGDWTETQLMDSGNEDGGCGDEDHGNDGDPVKTKQVEDEEGGDVGGGVDDNANKWTKTQLDEKCEVDGVNNIVGDMVETQLVEEPEEDADKDGLNGHGEHDLGEWGKTQLVEDSDEDIGDYELSDGTVVLSDNESLSGDERVVKSGMDKRDVKFGMEGRIEGLTGEIRKHDDNNLVDSDASTDEEGDTDSVLTCGISEPRDTMSVNCMKQGKQMASDAIHPMPKVVDQSTKCSTSFGEVDNDSHGYVQNHDKGGAKSRDKCSTAKKLFADTTAEDGEKNSRCLAGLSYAGSQEPGDLSQANAFDVVDRLISINCGLSSQETIPNKLEIAKPHASSKRGTLMLAEKVDLGRSSNGKAEIFEFVDNLEDEGGGDFFSKNRDILLPKPIGRGEPKSHYTRAKKPSTKKSCGENKIGEAMNKRNSKLPGRLETIPLSHSRLFKSDVKSKQAYGSRTKKNLLKDLDNLSNAKSLEEQERADVALNDVGPDTQMAVEAMEALVQCSPAKSLSAEDQPLLNRDTMAEKSGIAKSHLKNGSQRTSNIQEGVTTRSKRRKVPDFSTKPQKERLRGSKVQESSEPIVKVKHKQTKSVPEKSKVSKEFIDENKYHGTPIAHRTRHCGRNDPSAFIEFSNKHLRRGKKLTGDSSTIQQVQNNRIAIESGLSYFEKESTEQICTNNDQDLQQSKDGSTQRTSVNNAQNLETHRVEPTTDVTCRDIPLHPKRRRTPTKLILSTSAAAANHEIPSEVARPYKKRRIFVRSVSDLLKYAKREPSHGRSASMLSSILEKSLAASPVLNFSVCGDSKTSSDVISSAQRPKESSHDEDTSKSPENNPQVPNRSMKTPSKVVNELSPTFSPANPSKGSSRNLSKASVARELLKLDPENVLPNQQRKDSRRRKDMAHVSILLSHHLDDDVVKRQKKILARLRGSEAFSMADATHFVADRFCRTKNMLEAITIGKPIVTSMWLENCGEAGCFIDERKYILRDEKKEKEIGFSMPISLASACNHPLLLGKRVFVTSNVKPSQAVVTSLVKASSGQPLERVGRSIMNEKEVAPDLLVISCEEDYQTCAPLLEKGASVFSVEFLLNGIVIQKLEYERHRLFLDRVKQTRSSRWLKDTVQDRFVPVPKRRRR
ncbi:BRCT domain-containing DNA repair protein [Zea mays]|nr:BRCT domain-containing DNA repair protein [Zea mays]